MIVHTVTGLVLRFLMGAVVDAHERGVLTPELRAYVEEILNWTSTPGDETA